jgi:HEAT repeat protein
MKKPSSEARLEQLGAVNNDPFAASSLKLLGDALADRSFAVVGRAAEIVARHQIGGLDDDLCNAFDRVMRGGGLADKGCTAKTAIANALYRLGAGPGELLLRGARHVQREPVWGGTADTAGNLRGLCGMALVAVGHPDALFELVRLLTDPEIEARRHAVRAVAATETTAGELLLRLKTGAAANDPEIRAECLAALMQMAPDRSLEFVADHLRDPVPAVRETAAIALGESHLPEALAVLTGACRTEPDLRARAALLLPIALVRTPESFAFLLEVLSDAPDTMARAAAEALRIYQHDDARAAQIRRAAAKRGDRAFARWVEALLGR